MKIGVLILLGMMATGVWAQDKTDGPSASGSEAGGASSAALAASSSSSAASSVATSTTDNSQVPSFLKNTHTSIKDPLSLRDPFKRQNSILFKDERQRTLTKDKDSYSNYVTDLPTNVGLNTLKLVGILLGPQRRAIVRVGNNNQSFSVREGMSLGE